ncbi:MAG: helix-turn-helix domain-containing protein [Sphingobium sp.]|jgi:AraC-like DNA-binding protein
MIRSEDVISDELPVVGLGNEYISGFVDPMHSHPKAQLLYAISGVMEVTTERCSFIIPTNRAMWIPADCRHEVRYRGSASLRTLYIDNVYDLEPSKCRVLEVSNLLRALIVEAVGFSCDYDVDSREGRLVGVLLEEIRRMSTISYHVTIPTDRRLARVCRAILDNPADARVIDDWASLVGMSRRSFTRLFREELGMGFALWRQQVRLLEAISLLEAGHSVASVAFDVGYESPSAFTAMFTRTFGRSPSLYAGRS